MVGIMSRIICPTYSLVYPPDEIARTELAGITPAISLFASAYFDVELAPWLPGFVAQMALMQPINAEIQSAISSDTFLGAIPDVAAGSRKGRRKRNPRVCQRDHCTRGAQAKSLDQFRRV